MKATEEIVDLTVTIAEIIVSITFAIALMMALIPRPIAETIDP